MRQVLGDFFEDVCDRFAKNECIYFPTTGKTYTYEEFHQYVCDIEKGLVALGLNRGDFIAIKSNNTPEWIAMQWACFKLGIIVVGLNSALTHIEVQNAMLHTGAKILFTDDTNYVISKGNDEDEKYRVIIWDYANQFMIDLGRAIQTVEIEERNLLVVATDPALILFTSGTTSEPKAVLMKNSAIVSAIEAYNKILTYKTSQENALICTPLAHMMGCLYGIMPVWAFGGKITLVEKFKVDRVLGLIQQQRCTIFNGVPTMFIFLLDEYQNYDISSLRTGLIAGSYVSDKLYKRIHEELGIKELLQAFGQTETLAATGITMLDPWEKRLHTTGQALEGVEIKIINCKKHSSEESEEILNPNEQGEVLIRSPYCMVEYLKNESATKKTKNAEGWIHTGDVGYLDEEGYLHIKSRLKDIIIKGGENICPAEIENELVKIEEVKEAIVVGVPDDYKDEEICAFVIPEGEEPLHIDQIKAQLKKSLAKYKIPKYIIRLKQFPMTGSGKVRKEVLKDLYDVLQSYFKSV